MRDVEKALRAAEAALRGIWEGENPTKDPVYDSWLLVSRAIDELPKGDPPNGFERAGYLAVPVFRRGPGIGGAMWLHQAFGEGESVDDEGRKSEFKLWSTAGCGAAAVGVFVTPEGGRMHTAVFKMNHIAGEFIDIALGADDEEE